MDILDALDEIKSQNARHASVDKMGLLETLSKVCACRRRSSLPVLAEGASARRSPDPLRRAGCAPRRRTIAQLARPVLFRGPVGSRCHAATHRRARRRGRRSLQRQPRRQKRRWRRRRRWLASRRQLVAQAPYAPPLPLASRSSRCLLPLPQQDAPSLAPLVEVSPLACPPRLCHPCAVLRTALKRFGAGEGLGGGLCSAVCCAPCCMVHVACHVGML
jgi:hypothetical protein